VTDSVCSRSLSLRALLHTAVDVMLSTRTNWQQWTDAIYKIENTHLQNYCKHLLKIIQCSMKIRLHGIERGEINDIVLSKYI
jgi:peroxiredoxin family protein